MPTMRRRRIVKRELTPDVKYNSELVARLINVVMKRGKKSTAQGIVYGAFEIIRQRKKNLEPLEVFLQALENAKPRLEVKSRRVGGATYQVPVEVNADRQVAVALRWLTGYAGGRKGQSMRDALAGELLDAFENTGSAVKKKEDTHKMAAANKAFAHYRW
jgi:small subunit ribosomal protein S7